MNAGIYCSVYGALASTFFVWGTFVGSRSAQMLLPASSAPSFLNLNTGF